MTHALLVISPAVDTGAIAVDATLAPFRSTSLSVEHAFLDAGPASVETEADIAACLPGLLRIAHGATAQRADAIVINCMCDPGVTELRRILNVPVFGAAQTSMHAAASLGSRFAVIDVLEEGRGYVENQVRQFGLSHAYASHRALGIPVLELYREPERTLDALEREAHAAVERDGADTLLLGCTGLAELADLLNLRLRRAGKHYRILEPLRVTLGMARAVLDAGFAGRGGALSAS